jgi:TPR repeat protein
MIADIRELQEQIARHEAEIASCLGTTPTIEARLSRLEAELTRIGAVVTSEQLYHQGQELINTEDIRKSCVLGLSLLKESAALGHGDAAFACGCHLERGLICEPDEAEAKRYFDLSASLGNTSGLTASSFRFAGCDAFPADRSDAVGKVKLSADRGNALGQVVYGSLLSEGRGVAENAAEGFRFWKLAADQGNPIGQMLYFRSLTAGKGTEKNMEAAARWAKGLADKGNAIGQFLHGVCLSGGVGCEPDAVTAAKFCSLSASQRCPFGLSEYGDCLSQGRGIRQDSALGDYYSRIAGSVWWLHRFHLA